MTDGAEVVLRTAQAGPGEASGPGMRLFLQTAAEYRPFGAVCD